MKRSQGHRKSHTAKPNGSFSFCILTRVYSGWQGGSWRPPLPAELRASLSLPSPGGQSPPEFTPRALFRSLGLPIPSLFPGPSPCPAQIQLLINTVPRSPHRHLHCLWPRQFVVDLPQTASPPVCQCPSVLRLGMVHLCPSPPLPEQPPSLPPYTHSCPRPGRGVF